jgi:hypothetical protein
MRRITINLTLETKRFMTMLSGCILSGTVSKQDCSEIQRDNIFNGFKTRLAFVHLTMCRIILNRIKNKILITSY